MGPDDMILLKSDGYPTEFAMLKKAPLVIDHKWIRTARRWPTCSRGLEDGRLSSIARVSYDWCAFQSLAISCMGRKRFGGRLQSQSRSRDSRTAVSNSEASHKGPCKPGM
jgi:hypothetical protein